jgi:tetraacyldisaccharide 4'-kinase
MAEMQILSGAYSLISRAACRAKSALVRTGAITARRAPLPVLSVGNLTVGGSEKTPLVMEIMAHLESRGIRPALVSRGYRGLWEKSGGILSDGARLLGGWRESGDEPFMIALRFPKAGIYLGKHRYKSCLAAAAAGFEAVVLDDGFQHVKLARDLDIVIHDPASRAPLREGPAALRRAGALLLKGSDPAAADRFRARFPALPVFEYAVAVKGLVLLEGGAIVAVDTLRGRRISAFCGIARPERFFAALEGLGLAPEVRTSFPDHFAYPDIALTRIATAVRGTEAIVVTEKDAVKLRGRSAALGGAPVFALRIGLALPDAFFALVVRAAASRKAAADV